MVPLPQANSASAIAGLFWEHLPSDIRQQKSLIRFWEQKIVCVKGRKPRKKMTEAANASHGRWVGWTPLPPPPPPTPKDHIKESWNDCSLINQPADFPHNVPTIKFSTLQGTNNVCYNGMEKTIMRKQTMTSIGIGRVWGNGICFGIFTQLIDRRTT